LVNFVVVLAEKGKNVFLDRIIASKKACAIACNGSD